MNLNSPLAQLDKTLKVYLFQMQLVTLNGYFLSHITYLSPFIIIWFMSFGTAAIF